MAKNTVAKNTVAKNTVADTLGPFFGVAARGRSYLNALYNLLAFPLGVAYFVFLVVGLSLGLGLLIIWIGVFILAAVLLLSRALSAFERQQAILLLGAHIGPMGAKAAEKSAKGTFWQQIKAFVSNRVTWTGPMFLFLKFPLGIVSFVFAIAALSISLSILLAPFYYYWSPLDFYFWYVDTLPEALLCSLLGILLFFVSLHALNGLAWIWRELATLMLGKKPDVTPAAATPVDGSPTAPAAAASEAESQTA